VPVDVGRLHLPTGWVLLEDSIELQIRDRRVEPRPTFRDSGQDVLRDNLGAGRNDPLVPSEHVERLAKAFGEAGADVAVYWEDEGHHI
jgi:hypothetical protein